MGKHEAKPQKTRKAQIALKCMHAAKHPVSHISGLIVLHTVATLILTKSPIALILH